MEENKLSYEDLEKRCKELFMDNQQLLRMVSQLQNERGIKRIEFLFKVVENQIDFSDSEFVNKCIEEIKDSIYPKEEEIVNQEVEKTDE